MSSRPRWTSFCPCSQTYLCFRLLLRPCYIFTSPQGRRLCLTANVCDPRKEDKSPSSRRQYGSSEVLVQPHLGLSLIRPSKRTRETRWPAREFWKSSCDGVMGVRSKTFSTFSRCAAPSVALIVLVSHNCRSECATQSCPFSCPLTLHCRNLNLSIHTGLASVVAPVFPEYSTFQR